VLLDTSVMTTIHAVDETAETATVDCGVVWRDLVTATLEKGMVPRVLTNNLGVQISGTLSMAGLGVASFRYGTQADNAVELQVVTGAGEIVTCSREQNRELFDVVRCGLGQFGVITRATIRLRQVKSTVRKYFLGYVKRHGGKFPASDWLAVIADNRPGSVHAPVWEAIKKGHAGMIEEEAASRGVVGSIARYVNSIQTK